MRTMKSAMQSVLAIVALASLGAAGPAAAGSGQMLRLYPCDGAGAFAKEFHVPIGASITGVRFRSAESTTIFPAIELVPGSVIDADAAVIRRTENARGDGTGMVTVLWSTAVVSSRDCYHVIVHLPRQLESSRAPRIGFLADDDPVGSYIVAAGGEPPISVGADLDIELMTDAGKARRTEIVQPGEAVDIHASLQVLTPQESNAVAATFLLTLPVGGHVSAAMHDARGRVVRTLISESFLPSGLHRIDWDGMSSTGARAARSIYFIRVTTANDRLVKKFVVH